MWERFIRAAAMSEAEKGHLQRAALRAFGPDFTVIDISGVRAEGKRWKYNFDTGRFYAINFTPIGENATN